MLFNVFFLVECDII